MMWRGDNGWTAIIGQRDTQWRAAKSGHRILGCSQRFGGRTEKKKEKGEEELEEMQ